MKLTTLHILPHLAVTAFAAKGGYRTSGCGLPAPFNPGTFTECTINTTNGIREYGVWLPDNYNNSVENRLIFSYHGANGNIASQRALDELTNPDFNTEYIVVYLQGVENAEGSTTWQGSPGAPADDICFTGALLDKIQSQLCIDEDHIYATGKSQGAGFVGQLACNPSLSARFAAFAPVSGAYYNTDITESEGCKPDSMPIPCSPGRSQIPILAFHGGADTTISYHGGFRKGACLPDIQYWVRVWAERDGLRCDSSEDANIFGSDGGFNRTYGNDVVRLVYDGNNIPHDWPATFANSDNKGQNLTSFNATTYIMGFFNEHSLRR